ncbi:MAG: cupin domain-containing protein [Chloroflexaceae bacterium]|jgi:quercetin dioxygenase-like cupin family protein|nr:cupin domain-containing protein [Chloroflexaceae bacterium]
MTQPPIHIVGPGEGTSYPGLGTIRCKIPRQLTGNACTVLELRLAPGEGASLHVHQHEDEVVLVQAGSCTVGHADASWQLEAGSFVVFPRQTAHFFRNTTDAPCTLIITAVPGGLDGYFAEISAAVVQQDAQAIGAINARYGITFLEA